MIKIKQWIFQYPEGKINILKELEIFYQKMKTLNHYRFDDIVYSVKD